MNEDKETISEDKETADSEPSNATRQGIDKDPGEEIGMAEQVTTFDLKAKKIDADPEEEAKKPETLPKE